MATKQIPATKVAAPATFSMVAYDSATAQRIGKEVFDVGSRLADLANTVRGCADLSGFGDADYDYKSAIAETFRADFSAGVVNRYSAKQGELLYRAIIPAGAETADGFVALTREEFDSLRQQKDPPVLVVLTYHLAWSMSNSEFSGLEKRPASIGGSGLFGKAYKDLIRENRDRAKNQIDQNWKRLKAACATAKRTRSAAASDFETWLLGATGKPGILDQIETRAVNAAKRGDADADIVRVKAAVAAFRKVWDK
jgi:DNA-binding GntR family transcriptional regulator